MPAATSCAPLLGSARALLRLSWARTITPALVLSMLGLIAVPMLFGALFASRSGPEVDPVPFLVSRYDQLVCALAAPLLALLLGTSAFSAEAEDGTLLYLVTTTTPRWWICAVRVLFAATLTALLSAAAVIGTGLLATGTSDPMGVTRAFAIATAFGGATYAALFTALAVLTRRALVTGLGYVLFWEGVLSTTFPGIHYLSIRQWMLAVAASLTEASNTRLESGPSVTASVVGAVVVVVGAIVLGGRKLNRPRLTRIGT
jgi:ABC-2 type transport system permease protein